ncbi:calcium homeostasis endoplasmic reticulum protein-like isoform X2 [Corticium candelabrum]|uniref:calcium homeostasis endoplasmic reticulum protein-like isoform X2 n=1 Tax=Corticium candelabrum TaxID=121492 RepID=UPI002E2705B8|nr:calcium homeostasis endoplasmic reticulum protein-like isoform X2 [Corticium candelabrum]
MDGVASGVPQPPGDQDTQNVIDKLAIFVARNGAEFEEMTKQKQAGNLKFTFLFGGEHHAYYRWKVQVERASLVQKQIEAQQKQLQEQKRQIRQAQPGSNPSAVHPSVQHSVQEAIIQNSIEKAPWQQDNPVENPSTVASTQLPWNVLGNEHRDEPTGDQDLPDMTEFEDIITPVVKSCSKESIQNGKNWVFSNAQSPYHCYHISQYLYYRVGGVPDVLFTDKLRLVYLISDILHHCARKNAQELLQAIESVAVPIICTALADNPDEQQKGKLQKVINIWQGNSLFGEETLQKMREAIAIPQRNHEILMQYHVPVDYSRSTRRLPQCAPTADLHPPLMHPSDQLSAQPPVYQTLPPPPHHQNQSFGLLPHPGFDPRPPLLPAPQLPMQYNDNQQPHQPMFHPPVGFDPVPPAPVPVAAPVLGPPVSGVRQPFQSSRSRVNEFESDVQYDQNGDIVPRVPYYELPAGLMVPLVKASDGAYKPIDVNLFRLPVPRPPSEQLLKAVEEFYAPPSADKLRDIDGWEKGALDDFYRKKRNAVRSKEERKRRHSPSRSPVKHRSRSRSPKREEIKSLSPQRQKRSRSPSPEFVSPFIQAADLNTRITEDNVGHQMLKRMGWEGAGLGAAEQGIQEPVKGGDIRGDVDKYKGLGMDMNDTFDVFRRAKSYTFNRGSLFAAGRPDLN